MSKQEQEEYMSKINTLREARKAAKRLYKAVAEARTAFNLANSEVSRLDAECTRALNNFYIDNPKEPESRDTH